MPNERHESLIYFISHEVKGWLTKNEAAFAAIAEGDLGDVSQAVKDFAETALDDTRKGVTTLIDILNATSLKNGVVRYSSERFDLRHAIDSLLERQRKSLRSKKITFVTKIPDDVFEVMGDEAQIRDHVLKNLLENAVRYTRQGEIIISLKRSPTKISLAIKDSGVGLSDEDKKNLFTEGGRGRHSRKMNAHSTGYGLFIAKQIVDDHGGKIWAESKGEGHGSTFHVEFDI